MIIPDYTVHTLVRLLEKSAAELNEVMAIIMEVKIGLQSIKSSLHKNEGIGGE